MRAKHVLLTVLCLWPIGSADAQPIFFGDPITADTMIDAGNPFPRGFGAYDAGGGSPNVQLIDGGYVGGSAFLYDESRLNMSGGRVDRTVVVSDNSTFTMNGGVVGPPPSPVTELWDVVGEGSSAIHLRGGRLTSGFVELYDTTSMHVYGTGLNLRLIDEGNFYFITGMLQDGTPINARGTIAQGASVFIHNVPEPRLTLLAGLLPIILLRLAGQRGFLRVIGHSHP